MKLTFFGTSAAVPTRSRNVSGMALQLDQHSDWWLIDCGEGTQHQVLRSIYTLPRLSRIFISHMHGDHCFGLMGLLATRGLQGAQDPVAIFGPRGLNDLFNSIRRACNMHFRYPVQIHECAGPEILIDDEELTVRAVEVKHAGQTLAFVFEEKPRQGRFRAEEAQRLNIPFGPVLGRLKRGERVTLDDGREIDGATLVDPPQQGRKTVIITDTRDASAVLPFAGNADLIVHEATYCEAERAQAIEHNHSTAGDAARLAAQAGASVLVMSHFSPRYDQPEPGLPRVHDLVVEARAIFSGQVLAASDFMTVEVPRRGKPGTPA